MAEFLSYGKQWLDDEDKKAVLDILDSDFLTQGPSVAEFEKAICEYTGAKYCVAVANGTAALHIAVAALDIPKDAEGITTPITFVASANCLIYNGIKPVFADIDAKTYNIDPKKIAEKVTEKTKVLIPVHFAGQACDMESISKIAEEKNLCVIEDAAHAVGSTYADGSRVGNCKYSDLTTFSFHPVKTITTGEGGAVTTNDEKIYQKLLLLRSHGVTKDPEKLLKNPGPWYYEMQTLGYNYRMCDMQAALGVSQMKKLDQFKTRRREIIALYNEAFKDEPSLATPFEAEGLESCFHLYVLKFDFEKIGKSRREVMEELKAKNIGTQVLYIPVHTQPYYRELGYNIGDNPLAESYYEQALSIPLYPKLSNDQVSYIIESVKEVIR